MIARSCLDKIHHSTISIAVSTSVLLGQVLLSGQDNMRPLPKQDMMLMDCCAFGNSLLATQWQVCNSMAHAHHRLCHCKCNFKALGKATQGQESELTHSRANDRLRNRLLIAKRTALHWLPKRITGLYRMSFLWVDIKRFLCTYIAG